MNKSNYQAYMLRIWKERGAQPELNTPIRLSLENTQTGTRIGFSDVARLIEYLNEQMQHKV